MFHEASPPAPKIGVYEKVANCTGLYKHSTTGRYYATKKKDGKRYECSLRTADRKIAERRMKEWVANLDKVDAEVEKTTLKQLAAQLVAINEGKAGSSRSVIRLVLQEIQSRWGMQTQVRDIRPSQIDEYLAGRGRDFKNTSYNRYAGVLKQLFELAVGDRIIAESPFERVRTPWKKPQTPIRNIPTIAQFEAIVASIRSQRCAKYAQDSADFIEFLGLAGLGQAEAWALTWGDVDWVRNQIQIRRHKTDVRFQIPIYPHLRPLMERMYKKAGKTAVPGARVFKFRNGKKALDGACARLGFKHFTQRNLRQCLIMRLWKAGVDRKLIAKWQGHQDGGQLILETYTEVFGDDDDAYEQQQLARLGPSVASTAPLMQVQLPVVQRIVPPHKRQARTVKFCGMENPYKPDEKVLTKMKGADVEATVTQVWQNEVQIKTSDGKLTWRTMHTVWYPGASPIPKPERPKAVVTQGSTPAAPVPAESKPQPDAVSPVAPTSSESTETQVASNDGGVPAPSDTPAPVACSTDEGKRRKKRKAGR